MTTSQTVVVERPPEGPARGKWPGPTWAFVVIASVGVVITLSYGLWRWLRSRKSVS